MHGRPRVMSIRQQQELPVIADDDEIGLIFLGLLRRFVQPSDRDEFTSVMATFYNQVHCAGYNEKESEFFESIGYLG